MRQTRRWFGSGAVALLGLTLTVVPVGLAGASTKGSNPSSPVCGFIRSEQKGSSSAGADLAKGLETGNPNTAKQALLKGFGALETDIQKAETQSFVKSAPANVKSAFKGLAAGVDKLKTALKNANGLASLETAFASVGGNASFNRDNTTLDKWATSICGSAIVKTTTVGSSATTP
jgi:hypothetical protein